MKIVFKDCEPAHAREMVTWCRYNIGVYSEDWNFDWTGNFERDVEFTINDEQSFTLFLLRWT